MEQVSLLLNRGLTLIERATKHTTGVLARDANGHKVPANSPRATCWCAIGALLKAADRAAFSFNGPDEDALDLLYKAGLEMGYGSPHRCNDQEGHAGAVGMYRRALTLLDEQANGSPTRAIEGSTA